MSAAQVERRTCRRFAVEFPIVLLSHGTPVPITAGVTRDISTSGVYFCTETWPVTDFKNEFILLLAPPGTALRDIIRVRCRGRVLRAETLPDGRTGVALTIDAYGWS